MGHGFLTLPLALKNSCNVYFFQLGLMVGMEGLEEYAYKYNLGERTGIDLMGEKKGQRPSIEKLKDLYGNKWPRGEILNNSVGQGQVLVTPMQMAVLMSALANNKYILKPQIVKYIKDPEGEILLYNRREIIKPFSISEESREVILEGLKMVVDRIMPNPLNMVGKTGSAENPHGETHAWFVGFGPREKPKIAFAILVEHGEYGEYHIPWALKLMKFCKDNNIPDNNW
jgi:penicillin-binding protein 2